MPRPPPPPARPALAPWVCAAETLDAGCRLETVLEASARARRPVSEAFGCYVVAEAASILHPAHRLTDSRGQGVGLGPRAVSPENVLLTGPGFVKLEGLASDAPERLACAAPERVRGQPLDGRGEVFSLGLVLLRLLTGRHLIPGAERFEATLHRPGADGPREACARELEKALLAYGPAHLSAATRAVSVELAPIVHLALAPEPAARYATGAELALALREHLRRTRPSFGPGDVRAELHGLGL